MYMFKLLQLLSLKYIWFFPLPSKSRIRFSLGVHEQIELVLGLDNRPVTL